jgi:protein-disulfide isomerase
MRHAVHLGLGRILAWALSSALLLAIADLWFEGFLYPHFGSAAVAAEMSQAEFGQRVRAYLLDHPEVINEVLNRLQAKQVKQGAAAAKIALNAHAADVFHDSNSPVGGNPNGSVTLVEFFDYNCPYCKMMAPVITEAEAADPQLRIVYKEFPILGPGSVFAAKAALAANKRGKYEAFHRALYQVRGHVDEAKVLEVAATVGIDLARMKADMHDKTIEGDLDRNGELGQVLQITGTPGFVVGDEVTTGAMDMTALQSLISNGRKANQATK